MKITDYSLEVYNFPKTFTNNNKLKQHFENLGLNIIEAKLARNYYGKLSTFIKLSDIDDKVI